MDPFSLLGAAGAGGGLPSITGGTAGPSSATGAAELGSFGNIGFSSSFAVGDAASAQSDGGGTPPWLWLALGGGAVLLVAVMALRR